MDPVSSISLWNAPYRLFRLPMHSLLFTCLNIALCTAYLDILVREPLECSKQGLGRHPHSCGGVVLQNVGHGQYGIDSGVIH